MVVLDQHRHSSGVIVLIFLLVFLSCSSAKQFAFQTADSMKHDFCALEAQYRNRSVRVDRNSVLGPGEGLTMALRGQQLSVLFSKRDAEVDADLEVSPPKIHGGYFVSIMEEAASRGGFTIVSDVAADKPAQFDNWTAYMHWGVDRYDIFADWWAASAEMLDQDVVFPLGFLDMSKVLIVKKEESSSSFVALAFSFMKPFSQGLWLTILASSIFAGLVFVVLERGYNPDDFDPEDSSSLGFSIFHSTWLSFAMITGAGGYSPQTPQGKVFTWFWSFVVLLIVSAYTANLASFLVVANTPTSPIKTLDDANKAGSRLCIPDLYDEVFSRLPRFYPNMLERAKVVEWGSDYYQEIRDGNCDVVMTTVFEWETTSVQKLYNADCDMLYPGKPFWSGGGGFPVRRDTSESCSSFVNEVLAGIFAQMDSDGFMAEAYDEYKARKADVECSEDAADAEGRPLTVEDMMGIFGILAIISVCMMLWALPARLRAARASDVNRQSEPRATEEEPEPAGKQADADLVFSRVGDGSGSAEHSRASQGQLQVVDHDSKPPATVGGEDARRDGGKLEARMARVEEQLGEVLRLQRELLSKSNLNTTVTGSAGPPPPAVHASEPPARPPAPQQEMGIFGWFTGTSTRDPGPASG